MPWYIKTYGDPKWGPKWPGAEIHHELPLKYGGTNSIIYSLCQENSINKQSLLGGLHIN
ncbi:hypothetical protein SAMN05444672_10832 [Bacillus sp. OK838]|nr:hypothetical protein SAMN05444672_10832 [Bacillus sp. OK838]